MGTKQVVCICCEKVLGCVIVGSKSECKTCRFDGCIFNLVGVDEIVSIACSDCLDFNTPAYTLLMKAERDG